MNSKSETVTLNIRRSFYLKIAPVLLWLLAVLVPVFVGRHIFLDSFKQQQEQIRSMARHHLMTRAREFEARLEPGKIIKAELELDRLSNAYSRFFHGEVNEFLQIPFVKTLPDFTKPVYPELKRFCSHIADSTVLKPVFALAMSEDPDKCSMYFVESQQNDENLLQRYRDELVKICQRLNLRSYFIENEPREARQLDGFTIYNDFFGIFDPYNTHFWALHGSFAGRYRERLYVINMRAPAAKGQGNHVQIGFLASRMSQRAILKKICQSMSNDDIQISFGSSALSELPAFNETGGFLSLFIDLPESFRVLFSRNSDGRSAGSLVLRLSISTSQNEAELKNNLALLDLGLFIFLSLSFLAGAGVSLGQFKFKADLARLVTTAFFVSMFFPLAGLAWLGASHTMISRETGAQEMILALRQKLKEAEMSFQLQRYRQQQMLIFMGKVMENLDPRKYGEYVEKFFSNDNPVTFKKHFNNYYLYSAADNREYYRGQQPSDRFRQNELPKFLSGPTKQAMLRTGALAHMSQSERQKISQVADFSSGVMEHVIDDDFIGRIFSSPGQYNDAAILARRDIYLIDFLRAAGKITGMLCLVTNNAFVLQFIDELNAFGSFNTRFELNGYRVEMDFFSTSDIQDRQLSDRTQYYLRPDQFFISFDSANSLYADSDASQINNLHLDPPHIIVTDTIFNRYIFAVARATARSPQNSTMAGPALLALLALASSLMLSTAVSRMLLIPVPPFLRAFREIKSNRYDWNLALHTGDEFDTLATSVNAMKIRLHERRKMMQLVSQTAIEAAQTDINAQLEPKRRRATILFSDIRGFTTICENHSAEEVVAMLNSYFTLMCPAIEENGGFIDKLIGDAIQAVFFGDDDLMRVLNACKAALEIRRRLEEFNADRSENGLFTVNNGIGIASGEITTGLTGSKTGKLEVAIMGEPLQQAALLESLSKHALKTRIIIDSTSLQAAGSQVTVDNLTLDDVESGGSFKISELLKVSDDRQ